MKSFIIISVVIFSSCSNTENIQKTEYNNLLKIKYINGGFESPIAITCDRLTFAPHSSMITDTSILDSILLLKIYTLINDIQESVDTNEGCDIRLTCTFIKNYDTIQICVERFNCIFVDGKIINENDTLIYTIFSKSGYYNYFPKKHLEYFTEINKFGIPKNYVDLSEELK